MARRKLKTLSSSTTIFVQLLTFTYTISSSKSVKKIVNTKLMTYIIKINILLTNTKAHLFYIYMTDTPTKGMY